MLSESGNSPGDREQESGKIEYEMQAEVVKFEPLYSQIKEIFNRMQDGRSLVDGDHDNFKKIATQILQNNSWNDQTLGKWNQVLDEKAFRHFSHDTRNIAAGFFGSLFSVRSSLKEVIDQPAKEMVKNLSDDESFLEMFDIALKTWPFMALVVEDITVRSLETKGQKPTSLRPLNLEMFKSALDSLQIDSPLKEKLRTVFFTEDLIAEDEEVVTRPGVVGNFIFNAVHNAAKEKIDANKIEIFAVREGDELVFWIDDNGAGMKSEQLDPTNEKFIFNEGKASSGTDSTGLGLADAPERLEKYANAKIACASRKRGDKNITHYPEQSQIFLPQDLSTMFEIRLPITKKEK